MSEMDIDYDSDERTSDDNPTEITDSTLLHPEDFATYLDDSTMFQAAILLAIQNLSVRGEQVYGLAIKRELENIYQTDEIHHGRLYPNLDTLKERNLIDKKPIDDRANSYQLTPTGKGFLKKFATLVVGMINGYEYEEVVGLK